MTFLSMPRHRFGAAAGLRILIGVALAAALAWPAAPAASAEPIGGFSRQPVSARRALAPAEQARLKAWNTAHPSALIDPSRVSSLELHFLKHAAGGKEFLDRGFFGATPRFSTPQAYEKAARALAAGRADGRRTRRFRRSDGATVTVETASGGVVVVAPSGRIKTFFNAAARCFGHEPAVRCTVSLDRMVRWVRRRTTSGRLIEVDYARDPLAGPHPLEPLPADSRPPSAPP
ncbi:MAG: hypothetical protein V3R38_05500 [bacterium]